MLQQAGRMCIVSSIPGDVVQAVLVTDWFTYILLLNFPAAPGSFYCSADWLCQCLCTHTHKHTQANKTGVKYKWHHCLAVSPSGNSERLILLFSKRWRWCQIANQLSKKKMSWLALIILQPHLTVTPRHSLTCWLSLCSKSRVYTAYVFRWGFESLTLSPSLSPPELLCYLWRSGTWVDVCSQINLNPVAFETPSDH